ncbi:hypothetical protein AB0I49_06080 [Streptomyces sp. NPDC050617]|uniref:hypothetical protein n=1 Tax=Streptomyces sp. NPDC050617 TaxID=3154628 RepID=UPI003431199B
MTLPTEGQYFPPPQAFFDWGRLTESTKRIAEETFDASFAKYQWVKPGGAQAATVGTQFFKFDPSFIKYDEKGLTIAGVSMFEKYSITGVLGGPIKKLKEKIDPPEPKKPSVSDGEITTIKEKLTTHGNAIGKLQQDRTVKKKLAVHGRAIQKLQQDRTVKKKLAVHGRAIEKLLQDRAHNASTKRTSLENRANRADSRRLGGSIPASKANTARAAALRREAAEVRKVEEESKRLITTIGH